MSRLQPVQPLSAVLDLQDIGAELHLYNQFNEHTMKTYNPSIAFHNGKLKIAVRKCNFTTLRHSKFTFLDGNAYSKTDVLYGDLYPETLNISNLHKLNLSDDSPTRTKVAGLEDVRLFPRSDGMHVLGFESDRITRSLHNESTSLAEYLIKGSELKYIRTLKKPEKARVEKNWMPTDEPSKEFEFTYSPTETWKDGKVTGHIYKGEIHGGTTLIKQKDGSYLSLVHEKTADRRYGGVYDRFVYKTFLARHDKQGIIVELSKPFTFGTHENIEFASGMVEYNDDFIISLGIRDAKFGLVKIKKAALVELLEPWGMR